ncbi:hypothetical protein OSB04_un001499 [Centaurea solstitialis]|uniref:Uncharacterized protein n=1 Tax=Centaurea solstitialis TaxID=347529 RepID=A0AA38VQU3_9ASTR|nr:hypothetical protein OSB04_un001499 [Centaurea solstitialis]
MQPSLKILRNFSTNVSPPPEADTSNSTSVLSSTQAPITTEPIPPPGPKIIPQTQIIGEPYDVVKTRATVTTAFLCFLSKLNPKGGRALQTHLGLKKAMQDEFSV